MQAYKELLPYANSEKEKQVLNLLIEGKSQRDIASLTGKCRTTIQDTLRRVKIRAANKDPELHKGKQPEGYEIKGVSTLYDDEGNAKLQWVKTSQDKEEQDRLFKEAIKGFLEDVPRIKPPKAPKFTDKDIIPWYQIGDGHLGMLSHEWEVGHNYDLKIAKQEICSAFSILFDECEPCERCVINDLGDFTHYENFKSVTEASGNALDSDGRFPKMINVYTGILRFIIDKALTKYKHVDIIINQGNHSRTNDIWAAELIKVAYGHTKRVHVLNNSSVFIPYRMGNTFVMTHHSDKTKPDRLIQVMSNDFRQDWGETKYHYIDIGHLHHKWTSNEFGGAIIEMWNTLAPADKYAHDYGYRASQSITRVDRSKKYGEVNRRKLPIGEIRDKVLPKLKKSDYDPSERRDVHTV